ncbi:MAG: HAMP domain-containing histidine kinase [Myxococcales bacterium]|nr:HAMP domain-containing histidine kinase [Myxococcales bacterium]MCB9643549.1 HAMP domain-containing histidine kinase [Myxococcales bacterium]
MLFSSLLSRFSGLVRQSFSQWIRQQDFRFTVAVTTLGSWIQTLVGVVLVLLALEYIPFLQKHVGIRFFPAFWYFMPAFLSGSLIHIQKKIPPHHLPVYTLGTSAGAYFFCCALMILSKPVGLQSFGTLYLFSAGFYGWLLRMRTKTPFPVFSLLVGTGASLLIGPTQEYLAFMLVMFPASLLVHFLLGEGRYHLDLQEREKERFRDTVFAQIQFEQSSQVSALREKLADVLGTIHDVNNHLQAAVLSSSVLSLTAAKQLPSSLKETFDDLDGAVNRATDLMASLHQEQRQERLQTRELLGSDLSRVIQESITNVRNLYSHVEFQTDLPKSLPSIALIGGEKTLYRILENLLLNACQGKDGKRGASVICVRLRTEEHTLVLEVLDNGEGLPGFLLENGVTSLVSTKDSTGLGLYTVDRLARANGGSIELNNQESSGAWIKIFLQFIEPEAATE